MKTRTIRVRCTFELDVEVPADWDAETAQFVIEENSCPGTNDVGHALEALRRKHDASGTCWACAANGKCEIVEPKE